MRNRNTSSPTSARYASDDEAMYRRLAFAPAIIAAVEWLMTNPQAWMLLATAYPHLKQLWDKWQNGTVTFDDAKQVVEALGPDVLATYMAGGAGTAGGAAKVVAQLTFDRDKHSLGYGTHPGAAALMAAREAVGQYQFPTKVQLTYRGMRRASGSGPHQMTDGVVWVEGSFYSRSGHKHHIEIPVMVHDGKVYNPEIFRHQGRVLVMAQSSFDDMIDRTEIYNRPTDRAHIFAAPSPQSVIDREPQAWRNPGMFRHANTSNDRE